MRQLYLIIPALVLSLSNISAQHIDEYWEVGLTIHGALYRGDLSNQGVSEEDITYGIGLSGRYYFTPVLATRGNFIITSFKGDDSGSGGAYSGRGFSFNTSLVELTGMIEVEPFGQERAVRSGMKFFRGFSPYFGGGVGLAFTTPRPVFPQGVSIGAFDPIEQDVRAGYSKVHFVFPMHVGFKAILDREWLMAFELGPRTSFTDYFDGISKSANPEKNDWYWLGGISIIYKPR